MKLILNCGKYKVLLISIDKDILEVTIHEFVNKRKLKEHCVYYYTINVCESLEIKLVKEEIETGIFKSEKLLLKISENFRDIESLDCGKVVIRKIIQY